MFLPTTGVLSWQWPQLLHHLKISAWVSLSLDRGHLRQRLMGSEPDYVPWWMRPPLCSSVFLIQKNKENVYLGWKGFWKHITSSKHSRSNATCFIKKTLKVDTEKGTKNVNYWSRFLEAMLELETGKWEDHTNNIQNQGPGWHLRSSLRQEAQRRQT